ncbi:unnamed protein product [Symbiodinium natans]|uniref:Transmembrane protein n=1 Tax=Symbiodinium natans TaxID=878477 RepID=A0A812V2T3_9DINO|nr:unnamed protein product [Symbiodinium natans]
MARTTSRRQSSTRNHSVAWALAARLFFVVVGRHGKAWEGERWGVQCPAKEPFNTPKVARKLFDRSFSCPWDGARRPGCAQGCSCGWTERCHPSYVFVPDNLDNITRDSRDRWGQLVDVGACGMDFRVPVLVSLLLPVFLLTCLISVRRMSANVTYSDLKVFRTSRRMDALCQKRLG